MRTTISNPAIGTRFGHIIIKDRYFKKTVRCNRTYYLCQCDCGNEFERRHDSVEKFNSCGKCEYSKEHIVHGSEHYFWQGCGDLSLHKFNHIISHAKTRELPFEINIEQAWELFLRQDKKCVLSGVNLVVGQSARRRDINTASLDRIDNSVGYTLDNIQWVHKTIQLMRHSLSIDKFIFLCNLVAHPLEDNQYNTVLDYKVKHHNFTGCGSISGGFWRRIKNNAINREMDFLISIEDAWGLFTRQNGRCSLTNQNLSFDVNREFHGENTASLDRINSDLGYTIDNTQWVHKDINKMKNVYKSTVFSGWCKLVSNQKFGVKYSRDIFA